MCGGAAVRPRAERCVGTEVLRCLVFSEWVTAEAKDRGGFHTWRLSECFHTKVQAFRCFHLGRPPARYIGEFTPQTFPQICYSTIAPTG